MNPTSRPRSRSTDHRPAPPHADPTRPLPRWAWTRRDLAICLLCRLLAVGARWVVIGRDWIRLDDPDGYLGWPARSSAATGCGSTAG